MHKSNLGMFSKQHSVLYICVMFQSLAEPLLLLFGQDKIEV